MLCTHDNSKTYLKMICFSLLGYYIVNYDRESWKSIGKQLREDHTAIDVANRAQILHDAFTLAKAGYLDYELVLELTQYLDKETEYVPWSTAISGFGYIKRMLGRTPAYRALRVRFVFLKDFWIKQQCKWFVSTIL